MAYEQDYDYLAECLSNIGMVQIASECHGNLSGLLCCQSGVSIHTWLNDFFSNDTSIDKSSESAQLLSDMVLELYYCSETLLNTMNFEFELFLPDDDCEISERIDALGEWCSGFLLGLSIGGFSDIKNLPEEMSQFLADCLEIARVGTTDLEHSEQDETVYTELVEYIRMGVMTLFEEIYQKQNQRSDSNDSVYH